MNIFSNIYHQYKSAVLFTLINEAFQISFNYTPFHKEITFLGRQNN